MFSIVIPLYNKEKYISKTIESVLKQTFQNYELLIVNDGSTDNSLMEVQKFKDDRIIVLSKANGGVSSARNYGMHNSANDYIAFLDADDLWHKDYLEEMFKLISKYNDCGMYSSAYNIIYKDKVEVVCSTVKEGIVSNYFEIMQKEILTWTSATIIKKEVYQKIGGFPIGMFSGQDTFYWAKIAKFYKIAFTPKILASYNYIFTGYNLRKGKLDTSSEKWIDLYTPGNFYLNEYIAKKALFVGFRYALNMYIEPSNKIIEDFQYTKLYRAKLLFLKFLLISSPISIKLYIFLQRLYNLLKN